MIKTFSTKLYKCLYDNKLICKKKCQEQEKSGLRPRWALASILSIAVLYRPRPINTCADYCKKHDDMILDDK